MKKRLNFPESYKQINGGSCGPNLMKQIILYKTGLNIPENNIINAGNCSHKRGTSIEGMIKISEKFNLNYDLRDNSLISDIINSINKNNPVILLIQAWQSGKIKDWKKTDHLGHYIGAIGYDTRESKIFYYDPFDGKNKSISYIKLEERWHDRDLNILYNHFGIFFKN